jgi:hypothetical protein
MKSPWVICFCFLLVGICQSCQPADSQPVSPVLKHKGVCWVGGRDIVTEVEIKALVDCNVTWISQTPFGWQRDANSPTIYTNHSSEKIWWGESDNGISATTSLALKAGIKTMLKPHLWVRNGWPGDILMKSDTSWQHWFENYETFIIHYATLAEANKIEIFCIGTELQNTTKREVEWRALISKIRKVYSGKLIYAANFHEEYEHIKFWDALDYIGVQAYFSLANKQEVTLLELVNKWKAPLASIERVHKKFNKPVMFTEIGYRNDKQAAIEPWTWPSEMREVSVSEETQALCYQAFFQSAWNKPWLAGAYFWKWYPKGPRRSSGSDFTPQGKQAEKILKENYRK